MSTFCPTYNQADILDKPQQVWIMSLGAIFLSIMACICEHAVNFGEHDNVCYELIVDNRALHTKQVMVLSLLDSEKLNRYDGDLVPFVWWKTVNTGTSILAYISI